MVALQPRKHGKQADWSLHIRLVSFLAWCSFQRGDAPETPRSVAGDDDSFAQWDADRPLSERLKLPSNEVFDPVPPALLRKVGSYDVLYHSFIVCFTSFYVCVCSSHVSVVVRSRLCVCVCNFWLTYTSK